MKRATVAFFLMFMIVVAVTARGDGSATPPAVLTIPAVGARIDASNASQFANLIPSALMFAIAHGLVINVVAPRRIRWPEEYERATEKYSAQVSLAGDDTIRNYVAGLPFPDVSPGDPHAGAKVAYNWRFGPFLPRELTLVGDQKTRAYSIDRADAKKLVADDAQRDYRNENNCEQIALLRFGDESADSNGVEWKERGGQCGPDRAAVITVRYSNPEKEDESWGWLPAIRKWREFSTPGGYPNQSCTYSCTQIFYEYLPPKSEIYATQLIQTKPELVCIEDHPAGVGIVDVDGKARFGRLDCEVRQVHVLALAPRRTTPEGTLAIRVHIDAETFLYASGEFFRDSDRNPDASVAIWSVRTSADDSSVKLVNDFYVPGDRRNFFLALDGESGEQIINANSVSKVVFNPRAQIYSDGRM